MKDTKLQNLIKEMRENSLNNMEDLFNVLEIIVKDIQELKKEKNSP
jgi:hypothetical protein